MQRRKFFSTLAGVVGLATVPKVGAASAVFSSYADLYAKLKMVDPSLLESQIANDLRSGAMTRNEYRALRGLPPFEGKS